MITNRALKTWQQKGGSQADYATQLLALRHKLTSLMKYAADAHSVEWDKIHFGHVGDLVEANRMLEEVEAFLGVPE